MGTSCDAVVVGSVDFSPFSPSWIQEEGAEGEARKRGKMGIEREVCIRRDRGNRGSTEVNK